MTAPAPGAAAASEASPPPPPPLTPRCRNCGEEAPGRYCASCGQGTDDHIASVGVLARETVEELAGYDSKLWRTLANLMLRPGLLTREYLAGRRARYIRPLRLYLTTSVLFFLVIALPGVDAPGVTISTATREAGDVTAADSAAADSAALEGAAGAPGGLAGLPDSVADGGVVDRIYRSRKAALSGMSSDEIGRFMMDGVREHSPQVMFALLPIFALILKLLYVRGRRLYVEHLIFALHFHAFLFAVFALMTAWDHPLWGIPLAIWMYVYLFAAMRAVYGQSRRKTALKYVALLGTYLIAVAIGLAAALFITVIVDAPGA